MSNREITLYQKRSILATFVGDILKIAIGIALAFALSQYDWSPKKMTDDMFDKAEIKVGLASEALAKSVDLTRDLIAGEVMSESTKKAIYILATGVDNDKKEIDALKGKLEEVQIQNAQLINTVNNALIPEATVKQAAVTHVVEPVRDGFVTVKVKVTDLWNTYEFQPQKVKSWVSNVF